MFTGITENYNLLAKYFLDRSNYEDQAKYDLVLSNRQVAYSSYDAWNLSSWGTDEETMAEYETNLNGNWISNYLWVIVVTPILLVLAIPTLSLSFTWFWTWENVIISYIILIKLLAGDTA